MLYNLKRLTGYALGFVLFYAPVALFQRCLFYLLYGSWQPQSIHGLCFRIPIEHILDGIIWRLTPISMLSTLLLLAAAFFLGPVFCGRLCPAGAFTEYLSKLVPSKFQISWHRYTEIAPIRYGMLAGFCLVPFFGGILACSYCNFWCPVGAAQGLMHAIGCRLPFVLRMRVDKNQCIGCGLCEKKCPMESAELAEGKAQTGFCKQ